MAERAALDVLPGEADRDAVYEQRTERERFGVTPVERSLEVEVFGATLQLPPQLRVRRKAVGKLERGPVDAGQHLEVDAGRLRHDRDFTLVVGLVVGDRLVIAHFVLGVA